MPEVDPGCRITAARLSDHVGSTRLRCAIRRHKKDQEHRQKNNARHGEKHSWSTENCDYVGQGVEHQCRELACLVVPLLSCMDQREPVFIGVAGTVSLVNLIATPSEFDGKYVRVRGFVVPHPDDPMIYLSQEDAEHGNSANAVRLDLDKATRERDAYLEEWFLCEGRFVAGMRGSLVAIQRFEPVRNSGRDSAVLNIRLFARPRGA